MRDVIKLNSSRETILFYGLPSIAVFSISTLVSLRVGADFDNDPFVRWGTLTACCTLLWLVYILFQDTAQDFVTALSGKRVHVPTITDDAQDAEEAPVCSPVCEAEPATAPATIPTSADYRQCRDEYAEAQAKKKAAVVASIMEYASRTMPPFLCDSEMVRLLTEIDRWCRNPDHQPEEVRVDRDSGLSPYDLRHFVWNIGERLAPFGKYDLDCRATFVRRLFRSEYRDHEHRSLKNMTVTSPNKDKIPIDRPLPDDTSFHYPKPKGTNAERPKAA